MTSSFLGVGKASSGYSAMSFQRLRRTETQDSPFPHYWKHLLLYMNCDISAQNFPSLCLFACCCVKHFVLRQPTNVHVPVWMLHLEGSRRYIHKWWLIFATVIQTFWLHTRANEWKMTSCCSCIVHAARDMKPHVVVRLDWCSHESFWKLFTETRLVYARLYIRETKSRCFDERFGRVSVTFACQHIYENTLFDPGIKNKNTCT